MASSQTAAPTPLPEIAFYYPNPFWGNGDWIKNLILFFDGVGLLVPDYMKDRVEESDPAIVAGLREHGLLHVLEPERLVDKAATARLAEAMVDIIVSGVLDPLAKDDSRFDELSYSRLGGYGDEGLAAMIRDELIQRGLARKSEDGKSIPMHPMVRSLVLVLLAQILREPGRALGFDLSPATDRPAIVDALRELLSLPDSPSAGRVVAFDLNTVGVDVGAIPLDEVLGFRKENFELHRKYLRAVRLFVHQLSAMSPETQALAFQQRQAELESIASELRNTSRRAWKQPASFALTMVGAGWTVATGDPLGAVLAGAGGVLGLGKSERAETGAYSYVFSARSRYGD
jgi:hypothetical protein